MAEFNGFSKDENVSEYNVYGDKVDEFKPISFCNTPKNIKTIVYEPGSYTTFLDDKESDLINFNTIIANVIGGRMKKNVFFYLHGNTCSSRLKVKILPTNLNNKNAFVSTDTNAPRKFSIISHFDGDKQIVFKVEFGKIYNKDSRTYDFGPECNIFNYLAKFANSIMNDYVVPYIASNNPPKRYFRSTQSRK